MRPPKARVGVLAFDKLDVEKGMEIKDPRGQVRWLKQPWSVLAWQLAGSDGIKLLHADNKDEERETPPAENLMSALFAMPERDGLSTLVLIDEVLMYARARGEDPAFRGHFQNFFQYMTQAATKVDRCAIIASLLATDPRKSDKLGKEITQELYAIFRREREEGVQPVVKEDVAEVLRRRFFTPKSIENKDAFREHVITALKGISDLDEQTRKEAKHTEERFIQSYPFHPDLTEVFYTKWTNLESFQRTRGVLRTFALGRERKKETLDEFFEKQLSAFQRSVIRAACVEMWEPFRQSLEHWVPQCRIVYDKFHILQHAGQAVDEVRRAEFFRKGGAARDLVRGKRWLLLTSWLHLDRGKRRQLNALFALNRRILKAYLLKESLSHLWNYTYEGAMLRYLQSWIDQLRWQRLKPMEKLAHMLLDHLEGILNYCRTKVPMGVIEAVNGNIKALLRRGRGYRDMNYLLLKAQRLAATKTQFIALQKAA